MFPPFFFLSLFADLHTSVKGARTCWECKQRHGRCGTASVGVTARAMPAVSAEPSVAQVLGEVAAQVFDLSVASLNRSETLTQLERKVDALTETVRWIAEVMGAEGVATGERELTMAWAKSLERITPVSEDDAEGAGNEMEVDEAKVPSTSDTGDAEDAETTDEEEEEEGEEEGRGWKGKGKGKARDDEETSEEEDSEGSEED